MAGELDNDELENGSATAVLDTRPVDRILKDAERSSSPADVVELVARVKESHSLLNERAEETTAALTAKRQALRSADKRKLENSSID